MREKEARELLSEQHPISVHAERIAFSRCKSGFLQMMIDKSVGE